jgi:hypothetical protein
MSAGGETSVSDYVHTAVENSTVVGVLSASTVVGSRLWSSLSGRQFDDVAADATSLRLLRRWTRSSVVRQLITREPQGTEVVVDLRDSRVLGPVLGITDRLLVRSEVYWRQSLLARLVRAVTVLGEQFSETRIGVVFDRMIRPPGTADDGENRRPQDDE